MGVRAKARCGEVARTYPTASFSAACSAVPNRTAALMALAPGYGNRFPSESKILIDMGWLQDGNSCSIAILHQLPPPIGTFGRRISAEEFHGGMSAGRN